MQTLVSRQFFEREVKKSRFIAVAEPVESPEEARACIAELRDPNATHNCWAYKVGERYRFFDDGEPGGTAGRPILTAIESQELDQVLVVVIRYFGGIKLGTGGLVRAYGGTAAECLRIAPKQELRRQVVLQIEVPFDDIGAIYALLERFDSTKLDETFGEKGLVLRVEIDQSAVSEFDKHLAHATRGRGVARRQEGSGP